MNKKFMYLDGTIIVIDHNGTKHKRSYVDNIEDILVLENEVEFLKKNLIEDEKRLSEYTDSKFSKSKKCFFLFSSVALVGATFGLAEIGGYSHEQMINTIVGPISEYLAFTIPVSCGLVVGTQTFSLMSLLCKKNKTSIKGLEEKIKFEKEMIEVFSSELNILLDNPTYDKTYTVVDKELYNVHYNLALDYLKAVMALRYSFGCDTDIYINLYNEGKLFHQLSKERYEGDVITEFADYIKTYLDELKKDNGIVKK